MKPPVHFHSSDKRFCGSRKQARQFTFSQEFVTCLACRDKDAKWVMERVMKFHGLKNYPHSYYMQKEMT